MIAAKHQHDNSPLQVDVDSERALIDCLVAERAEGDQQHSKDGEQKTNWQSNVESHHFSSLTARVSR